MEKMKCFICGKEIEGFTFKHVETLMAQHQIKHKNERREKERNRKNESNKSK